METKQPGYYRMLLENIEQQQPAEAVTEDKAQTIALARSIKDYIEKALSSQDPKEIERLLYGARNSMDDIIHAIQRGGVAEGSKTDHPALVALARKAMGPRGISHNDLGGEEREAVMALAQGKATGAQRARAADILAKFYSNDRVSGPSSYAPAKLPEMDMEEARRGDSVSAGIGTTLVRNKGTDDEEEVDIWIEFTATMVSPGFAGDRYDPPHGAEWEFEIDDISVDLPRGVKPGPEDQLTDAEKAELEAWFDKNLDRAEEVANDKMSDGY